MCSLNVNKVSLIFSWYFFYVKYAFFGVIIKTPSSGQNCNEVNQSWTLPIDQVWKHFVDIWKSKMLDTFRIHFLKLLPIGLTKVLISSGTWLPGAERFVPFFGIGSLTTSASVTTASSFSISLTKVATIVPAVIEVLLVCIQGLAHCKKISNCVKIFKSMSQAPFSEIVENRMGSQIFVNFIESKMVLVTQFWTFYWR